jgi:NTP pyrophosphatase (non-canonical NTP hydrolase)
MIHKAYDIHELSKHIGEWRRSKEFFTPDMRQALVPVSEQTYHAVDLTHADAMLGKLMLVVSELSEAAEAVRKGDAANFEEEIADTFIRLFDISEASGLNIVEAIAKKMEKNWQRPIKHGKKINL